MTLGETTPSIGGPSFPWEAPNVYQHLMELRARGELRDDELDESDGAAFLDKYGAEEYWSRTKAAREDGAVGYAGHAPHELGARGIGAPRDEPATATGRGEPPAEAALPNWSDVDAFAPSLAEIRADGYLRRHANEAHATRGGMRRLCDEEELHPENQRAVRQMPRTYF